MKTKELIRQLQEADPSGELECTVDGVDIFAVWTEPGYYDGPYEILIRDPDLAPYYDVVGGIISTEGTKVRIRAMSLRTALLEEEVDGGFFPICLRTTYANPESNQRLYDRIDEWRAKAAEYRDEFKQ